MKKWRVVKCSISILLLFSIMMVSGCEKKQLFVNKDDKYAVSSVEQNDLETEEFYIKEGSYFYEPYKANQSNHVIYMEKDSLKVPSAYSTSIIAIKSVQSTIKAQSLDRYKYLGYSFGLFGGTYNSDGYISFPQNNIVKDTTAYDLFYTSKASEIRLVSINGQPVTASMVSDYGVITGLEEKGVYQIAYYLGSTYKESNITADEIMLEYMESYTTDSATDTKNGYMSIALPNGMPSGYYMINDKLFKYYDYQRGEQDDSQCDMNTQSQMTEVEKMKANSQQYRITVKEKTTNILFSVSYNIDECPDENMQVTLIAPDETTYEMIAENGVASIEMAEVMAGNWIINIKPQNVNVDISYESTVKEADTIAEDTIFTFDEDKQAIEFFATYDGDGNIWGIVTFEDGTSTNMTVDSKNHLLTADYSYLKAGTYTVTIYHYIDTEIKEVNFQENSDAFTEDVVIIEE